jgi:hypothetical protein
MPRSPLPIGTWGRVRTQIVKTDEKGKAVSHRAQAKYRDHDGGLADAKAAGRSGSARYPPEPIPHQWTTIDPRIPLIERRAASNERLTARWLKPRRAGVCPACSPAAIGSRRML